MAALGTVLLAAPIASAADGNDTTASQSWAPSVSQPAGDDNPDLGMLGGEHEFKFDHSAVIICERCQIAKGDIINVGKIIIKHHDKHHEDDMKPGDDQPSE